jgi:hypothetical protein
MNGPLKDQGNRALQSDPKRLRGSHIFSHLSIRSQDPIDSISVLIDLCKLSGHLGDYQLIFFSHEKS